MGVVGAIVPWNFPLNLASWKVAPALAAGCTVVLKPAHETPLTALMLGELAVEAGVSAGAPNVGPGPGAGARAALGRHPRAGKIAVPGATQVGPGVQREGVTALMLGELAVEAGFPAGALNVVPGPGAVAGAALVRHPGVDKIAFTGSTEVGQWIMREAAATVKRVTLELGGKSPNIIFADADLPAAVRGAQNGIFYGKGEVCAAGSRLLVEQTVHDQVLEQLAERAKKLTPGEPLDVRPRRRHLDQGHPEGAPRGPRHQGRHCLDQHVQLLRSRSAVRRLQVLGVRARPGTRGAGQLYGAQDRVGWIMNAECGMRNAELKGRGR